MMHTYFPIQWNFGEKPGDGCGGPPVADAGALYVCLDDKDLAEHPDNPAENIVLRTSLMEMVKDTIEGWQNPEGVTDEEHVPTSIALAAALRRAADVLDAALPVKQQNLK